MAAAWWGVTTSITNVGAHLLLTGRREFIAAMKESQKSLADTGKAAKDTGTSMGAAAAGADKLTAAQTRAAAIADKLAVAQRRVVTTQQELAAATREYDAAMAGSVPESAAATAATDRQVIALERLKKAEAEAAVAAEESAKVQAAAAAAAADATVASADKSVAADTKAAEGASMRGRATKGALLGVVATAGIVGYESVKLAAGFQTQMTR